MTILLPAYDAASAYKPLSKEPQMQYLSDHMEPMGSNEREARRWIDQNDYRGQVFAIAGDMGQTEVTKEFAESWAADRILSMNYDDLHSLFKAFPFIEEYAFDYAHDAWNDFGPREDA